MGPQKPVPTELLLLVLEFVGPARGTVGRLWRVGAWAWLEASQRYQLAHWGGLNGRPWGWTSRPTPAQQEEWDSWKLDYDDGSWDLIAK